MNFEDMMLKQKLKAVSQRCHHLNHILFSAGSIILVSYLTKTKISLLTGLAFSLTGALLPDIDHLFFIFGYGRKTDYAIRFKKLAFQLKFRKLIEFASNNHKDNFAIYSHNLATLAGLILLVFILQAFHPNLSLLAAALASHFIYDVLEDLLFKGKLNPNWFLKFTFPK